MASEKVGEMITLSGRVARGHRVASGLSGDPRFPAGTIAPQLPFLKAAIADFETWLGGVAWPATINVALAGVSASRSIPEVAVGPVRWTEHFPPERFLMSRCLLMHQQATYHAWLYTPDPATKPDHFQPDNLVELVSRPIPNLSYDDPVALLVPPHALMLTAEPATQAP